MKTGDWILCEFEVKEIKEMEDGRVREVSDGSFSMSGYDLSDRCFPLTGAGKNISDHFEHYSKELHAMRLDNMPDIHRYLVGRWCEAMGKIGDDAEVVAVLDCVRDFVQKCAEVARSSVDGVYLFRSRP